MLTFSLFLSPFSFPTSSTGFRNLLHLPALERNRKLLCAFHKFIGIKLIKSSSKVYWLKKRDQKCSRHRKKTCKNFPVSVSNLTVKYAQISKLLPNTSYSLSWISVSFTNSSFKPVILETSTISLCCKDSLQLYKWFQARTSNSSIPSQILKPLIKRERLNKAITL